MKRILSGNSSKPRGFPIASPVFWVCAALPVLCSGCFIIKGVNGGHYAYHYDTGLVALYNHNFEGARKQFGVAWHYAASGFLGPGAEAAALYNYGLASGHTGRFEEAEHCIKQALELDKKATPSDPGLRLKRLVELARLYQAWQKNELAEQCYLEAVLLARQQHVDVKDPVGFAIVLEDYADVLEKIGKQDAAVEQRTAAAVIRSSNPGVEPKRKPEYYAPPQQWSPGRP